MITQPLLQVIDLQTHFLREEGVVRAVDGVTFSIEPGGIMGLVGESGSGKSITGMSILGMLPGTGRIVGGKILFRGEDLVTKSAREMRQYRGGAISLIFQNAMTALDPYFHIGDQLVEAIMLHQVKNRAEAVEQALEMMRLVHLPDVEGLFKRYPHALSGGQRQRVVIALALACKPDLLIADEPTTALDPTVQYQVLDLLAEINRKLGTAVLMITHDFGVVARLCRTVAVMYAGRIVESGNVETVLHNPQHPYTAGLIHSIPRGAAGETADAVPAAAADGLRRKPRLVQIPGESPNLLDLPKGCAFAPRCSEAGSACLQLKPDLVPTGDLRHVACWMRGEKLGA